MKTEKTNSLPIVIGGMIFGKKYYCNGCKTEVKGFRDRPSAREYKITRLCQDCQDKLFQGL